VGYQPTQLRVLHVVASTDRRGAETAALALADRLGGEVVALGPGAVGGLDLPVLGAGGSTSWLAPLRKLAARADVVVAHGSRTLPALAVATIGLHVPFVYRSIGDPLAWVTTPARLARVRLAVSRASGVVALWRAAAAAWNEHLGVPAERLHVIPNGVDAGRFRPSSATERRAARTELDLPGDGPVVLCMGALSKEKRVDVAIRAVAALPGVTLAVVGDGPERPDLELLGASLGGGRVRFLGQTDRPEVALAASDAVVVPSDTEGMPAVAIEAGMAGLPVAATRVGGLAEIVVDGRSGLLVDRGDHAALGAAVARCLEERAVMGAYARSNCEEKFDIARLAHRWRNLLKRITSADQVPNNSDTAAAPPPPAGTTLS
jgi:glycosyltransferase involved in cell wall biosynthesis